jgi:exodeoxyribonuclease V gamma subunit
MAFYSYQSNRLEILADRLAELLRQPLRSSLAREGVVTSGSGLARWLTLRLAERLGVCANLSFQLPATFLWTMARAVLRQLPLTSRFDRPVLHWRLMALLRDLEATPCLAPVRAYLGDGHDEFRRYELAGRIADCFDQYLVYRPDWISRWEAGAEEHWQAELWRRLACDGEAHRVRVQARFHAALTQGAFDRRRLPERVSVIGVSALPPLDLELLAALARHIDIHLFLLNPCQEYWGDIQAERDLARLGEDIDPDEAYLTVGHPLLASLGKQGRDFIDLLQAYPRVEWDGFVEPEGDDLLHRLQADILHLRERGGDEHPPLPLRPDDRSLQIHACHGPMREVEVLHDQLLALFAADPALRPADVIVMTPDIARHGPLLEAVFASAPRERRIPFSVADRGALAEEPLIEGWFALLELGGGRFDASQVLSLLELPAVRRRFGLDEADLTRIRRWTRDAGIRWGLDAGTKALWELPATAEHTWRMGLDRLLLGYALPGHGRDLYAGILPHDEVEGDEARALGQWQTFVEALFGLDAQLRESRLLAVWVESLHAVLDRFFAPRDREENEIQRIRAVLETLRAHAEQAGFAEPVGLAVVMSALRTGLNAAESPAGRFLSGGVTCCALVPMRSIPFAVVAVLGLNDDAYPHPHQSVDFDRMATRFRRGDRARRHDDRYLFLETLLSARRCLYLSYVGQSIRDNTPLPPSVLISELLDVVDRSFYCPDGGRPREQLVTRHPLQAFSRRYFSGDDRWFSYARELTEASRRAGRGERNPAPLLTKELPEPEPTWRRVTLEGLMGFFRNPARWLLRERLGVRPDEDEEELETREPFVLDGLANHQLLGRMLELHREGRTTVEIRAVARGSGALPHGQVGECVFVQAQDRVTRFAGRLGRVLPRRDPEPVDLELQLDGFELSGRLTGMTLAGRVGYRLASIKANDYLNLWLHHLALNVAAPEGVTLQSRWVAEDKEIVLEPVEDAATHLRAVLDWYGRGTRRLLHFFPKSALAYVETLRKDQNQDTEKALRAARRQWEGDDFQRLAPERDHVYYQLAFRDTDPLDAEFEAVALAVFGPLCAQVRQAAREE